MTNETCQALAATVWTPEKAAQERIAIAALWRIYGDAETEHQETMQMLRGDGCPADVLAQTTATIIRIVIQKSRNEIPASVIAPALEILEGLAELAQVAGVFEHDDAVMSLARQRVREKLTN